MNDGMRHVNLLSRNRRQNVQPASELFVSGNLRMNMFQNISFEKFLLFGTLHDRRDVPYRHLRGPMFVVDATNRGIENLRVGYENRFEFGRCDLVAARDEVVSQEATSLDECNLPLDFDHLLCSIDNEEISLVVYIADVACSQESIWCVWVVGSLLAIDVALHGIGAADRKLAHQGV